MSTVKVRPAWIRWLPLTLAAITLGGCIVGPDHVPPTVPAPDQWHQELEKGRHANIDEIRQWWWLFEDPMLTELIERAKASRRLATLSALALVISGSTTRRSSLALGTVV